jgi:Trk K+ transport system NAD-binding subunit
VDFAEVLTLLVLGKDDEQNLALCHEARSQGVDNVVAFVNDPAALPEYERLGTKPFIPATQRVTMITMMARNPDALALLTSSNDGRDIAEVYLGNPHLSGELVRNLQLPGGFLVLAIRRDGQLLVPRGNTVLEPGDRLSILGEGEELQAVKGWLEGRSGRPLSQVISQEVARRV